MRYLLFEEEILHLFSVSRPRSSRFALGVRRVGAVLQAAAGRGGGSGGRRPAGLHPAGSVKALSAMSRRKFMDYSVATTDLPRQLIPSSDKILPSVDLVINVVNMRDLTGPIFKGELWSALPALPVVLVNFQESHGKCWCPLTSSDSWFLDLAGSSASADRDGRPQYSSFSISMKGGFLASLPAFEVVLYDLEDGEGTAQISLAVWMGDSNRLCVAVREAYQLPRMDSLGLSDPYAIVQFRGAQGGESHRTKTHTCTLNPVWDEECVLRIPADAADVETFLEVVVFDSDVDSDDLIGIVVLDVTSIVAPNPDDPPARIDGWFPLRTDCGALIWGSRAVGKGAGDRESIGFSWLNKLRRYEVESVLGREISPTKSLGSVRFSRGDLEMTKQDHVRSLPMLQMLESTRRSIKMSQMLGQAVSPAAQRWLRVMTALTAWKGWTGEHQDQILLENGNSQSKFASCVLEYHDVTQEGWVRGAKGLSDREVELEF